MICHFLTKFEGLLFCDFEKKNYDFVAWNRYTVTIMLFFWKKNQHFTYQDQLAECLCKIWIWWHNFFFFLYIYKMLFMNKILRHGFEKLKLKVKTNPYCASLKLWYLNANNLLEIKSMRKIFISHLCNYYLTASLETNCQFFFSPQSFFTFWMGFCCLFMY